MSRLLITSDTHFDNLNMFSTTTKAGNNSRFITNLSIFEGMLRYAKDNDYYLIHLGDLLNRRLLIPADVLTLVYEVIAKYKEVIQYYVVGNHDMFGNDPNSTPLKIFSEMKHVNVITEPTIVYFQPSVHFSLVPYGAPIPAASTKLPQGTYQILATHMGVKEAKIGPREFRMESDISIPFIRGLGYDLTLVGHIHKPQALTDDIIIVGSPYQLSFAETEEIKFFYVFDCEERTLVKYPTNAPKFLVHEVNTEEELKAIDINDGNFHRINVCTPKITFEDVRDYTSSNVIISFNSQSQYRYEGEIEEDKTRNTKEEVEDYYDNLETELEKDKLKKESMRIVEGV